MPSFMLLIQGLLLSLHFLFMSSTMLFSKTSHCSCSALFCSAWLAFISSSIQRLSILFSFHFCVTCLFNFLLVIKTLKKLSFCFFVFLQDLLQQHYWPNSLLGHSNAPLTHVHSWELHPWISSVKTGIHVDSIAVRISVMPMVTSSA